jgi:hypothetical protein
LLAAPARRDRRFSASFSGAFRPANHAEIIVKFRRFFVSGNSLEQFPAPSTGRQPSGRHGSSELQHHSGIAGHVWVVDGDKGLTTLACSECERLRML